MLLLQWPVVIAVGFFTSYIFVLSVLSLFARRRTLFPSQRCRRFAFVVPSHDEELFIERTVKSLRAVDYPPELFDVVVIADNCSDRTAARAERAGARVVERRDQELRGKGYALRWAFDRLLIEAPGYDALVVVDADSVVSGNFLRVMNYYLEGGSRVIQSSDVAAPTPGSWHPETTRLGFLLYNHVRPLGRKVLGFTAGLRGNGMCFDAKVLREVRWEAFSINEDLEYGLILLLRGIAVDFAPEAQVLATMPTIPKNAESQRARWERGRFPQIRRYSGRLLSAAVRSRSLVYLDALLELVTPALTNMVMLAVALAALNAVLALFQVQGAFFFFVLWMLVALLALLHMVTGVLSAGDRTLLWAVVRIPRYVLWKAGLYLKHARRDSAEDWVRTTRESLVRGEDNHLTGG